MQSSFFRYGKSVKLSVECMQNVFYKQHLISLRKFEGVQGNAFDLRTSKEFFAARFLILLLWLQSAVPKT